MEIREGNITYTVEGRFVKVLNKENTTSTFGIYDIESFKKRNKTISAKLFPKTKKFKIESSMEED